MQHLKPPRVAYVVKRYPRYSETFIVTEILAHEARALDIEIFALLPCTDTHFQDLLAQVKAPVNYLTPETPKASELWEKLQLAGRTLPRFWSHLQYASGEDSRNLWQGLLLALAIREKGITHIHAHFATAATSVARIAAKFAGVPYSFTAHAKDIFQEKVDAQDLRRKLADAAAIVTVSDFNVQHLRKTYGSAAARVRRIYNGLDLRRLSFSPPRNREPLIVSVGRLVEKKGFPVLVDACGILAASGVNFRCQIVGEGPLQRSIQEQVAHLELSDRVELLGPRPQKEAFEIIQRAAVFAAPCIVGGDQDRDGLPTVLLEAMALGTPCISTDVTGIPEAIRDGDTGLLCPQRDPEALADAMQKLLCDESLRLKLAGNARKLVESEFDVQSTTAQMRRIFSRRVRAARSRAAEVCS